MEEMLLLVGAKNKGNPIKGFLCFGFKKIREIPKDFPLLYWLIMKKIREAQKDFP